jgi:hypothetical protein
MPGISEELEPVILLRRQLDTERRGIFVLEGSSLFINLIGRQIGVFL